MCIEIVSLVDCPVPLAVQSAFGHKLKYKLKHEGFVVGKYGNIFRHLHELQHKLQKICNLQCEFRKTKPFGHALPPHGHSGQFWDQSVC